MTYVATKSSVLGLKAETTEGTLVDPSANTEYMKIQEDVTLSENKETLENAELTGSIGGAKAIQGVSAPAMSFGSYLKHSETEGVAPEAGPLYKALFGSENVAGAEYNTVASSTTTLVKVDTGEGASFDRGHALLIKDGTNGYSIRPVESVATDDLTLGFAVGTAPGTGVDLGKAVTYSPADSDHDSLSMHMYWGNGGLHQAVSGAKVTGYDITADAGQLINGSFTIEGVNFYNNPTILAATDTKLDFTETGPVTAAATIAAGTYADPEALASAIQTALQAAATVDTLTCTYDNATGKYTIASDGSVFSLLWSTGANTANTIGDKIGFTVSADDTGALTYTSDDAIDWSSPHTPSYDGSDPLAAKHHEVFMSTDTTATCANPSTVGMSIGNTRAIINSVCAVSGQSGSVISARENTITYTAVIDQHDVANFARYRRNDTVKFAYIFGTKSDGVNWDAGKSGCLYAPTAVISSLEVVDEDGIARVNVELMPFVSDTLGEIYLSFV